MTKTLINIEKEREKALEHIKSQGLRVLVCSGTGCVANGSLEVIERFKKLGVNVGTLPHHEKMTTCQRAATVFVKRVFWWLFPT